MGVGPARLVEGFAPPGQVADQRETFPLYTVLKHLGVEDAQVVPLGDLILGMVRQRIVAKALRDEDPGERFRYLNDFEHRQRINTLIVCEVLTEIGFSREELQRLQKGLGLQGLLVEPEKPAPKRATAAGREGAPETFTFLEEPAPGEVGVTVLKNETTGQVHRIRPDRPDRLD